MASGFLLSQVLEKNLKQLSLQDFPSGTGSYVC